MASTTDKARDALADHLEPGEVVAAAVCGQLDGGTLRIGLFAGLGGAAGVLAANAASARSGVEEGDVAKQLKGGVAVVVTDRRVVLCTVTKLGANPKDPVAGFALDQVTSVERGTKRIALVKVPTFQLTVAAEGVDPAAFAFEIPKVGARDLDAVLSALGHP